MISSLSHLLALNVQTNQLYTPLLMRLNIPVDQQKFDELLAGEMVLSAHDEIKGQLKELIKSEHPSRRLKPEEYDELILQRLNGQDIGQYGVWAYYPWSRRLVHILDEEEFIDVRTNRNQYKITRAERDELKKKKIGIVGLSVGQSIALTMATERICGEMRLADFDEVELSNLNRLRTGVYNLGVNKTVIAAREIAELDPYIKLSLFGDGLTEQNMDDFFTRDGKLDLFIEVCDGLDIKIQSRFKARELQIPVVMDTNDRGMLDVERFDLDPQRPVLHGLVGDVDPQKLKGLPMDEKIPLILKMVGIESISPRLKTSLMEIDQTITTWPQLASSVTLGGALTTDISRRILLDKYHDSGRYYVDFEQLIKDGAPSENTIPAEYLRPAELQQDEMLLIIKSLELPAANFKVDNDTIRNIVSAGIMAPSGGNAQPWKFLYTGNRLYVFHDAHYSHSLLDFNSLGSYLAIGAAIENMVVKAGAAGLLATSTYFPLKNANKLAAVLSFEQDDKLAETNYLEPSIYGRHTYRNTFARPALPPIIPGLLQQSIQLYQGAELHLLTDEDTMRELGDISATAEMLRILHPRGHYDTFTHELRWTKEENEEKRDGLDVATLGATLNELVALKVAADAEAIGTLRDIRGGGAFKKMVNKAVSHSSALGIITMPSASDEAFLKGGRAVERVWLEANLAGLSFQPITQLVFLLARLKHQPPETDANFIAELEKLYTRFYTLLPRLKEKEPVFIFRLGEAGEPVRSLRRSLSSVFFDLNQTAY